MFGSRSRQRKAKHGYHKPKATLHHEFLYLNHDSVINALSAFEAGKVDEIIQRTSHALDGDLGASISAGPASAKAARRKQRQLQEDLVRTRTWFSAFDAWHRHLIEAEAIGTFDVWSLDVRNQLEIGSTIEFHADVELSPVHKVLTTFMSYAADAGSSGGIFQVSKQDALEAKKTARMMENWLAGGSGKKNFLVYLLPMGKEQPRIVARLDEQYIIGGTDNLEGRFQVIGQVDSLLTQGKDESIFRLFRDVPPTPVEIETISQAVAHFVEPAKDLGVSIEEDDLRITHPGVVLRPVALFK